MENAASIVSKFGQALVEELQEIRGVGEKVVHLKDELASMNAVLRMLAESEEDSVDHLIREWTKQVRELASDAEDCVDTYKLRVRRPLPRPVDPGTRMNTARRLIGHAKLLPDIVRIQFVKLFLMHGLAGDLKALLARMVIISERRARYNVDQEALRRSACFAAASPATLSAAALRPANDPQHFIGMTGQVNSLAEKLRSGDDKDTKVFSIVGFGGLGKTTLAMEVCRDLEEDFPHQAQVSVSQAFDAGKDLEGLLKRMLHQMVKPKSSKSDGIKEEEDVDIDSMKEQKLTSTLHRLLRDKRYLIVIDDVWTIPAWDAIRSILPVDNKKKSRIIVTTRVDSVAKACSSVHAEFGVGYFVHHMEPLEKDVSEQLFINRVFAPKDKCPEDLKDSMQNILRKCGGLPLAIVSMASLLASYKSPGSKESWDKICKSIGSQLEINPTLEGMRQIVTLSYNHLPYHLKNCMMYLSIYPEDYEIQKKGLIRRWIAEGLVGEKRGLTLQEVAKSYFDELLSRNMIVPASISINGKVKSCRVHDMMLEVIVSRALEANFVNLVGGQCEGESHSKIRRLSIQGGGGPKEKRSMKHVRSLSTFHPQGHHLVERLGEFSLLRVLDLEDCKGVENRHMKHVCRMFLLKLLNLNGTNISQMPEEIGKLVHLQTLSLSGTNLPDLPQSVTQLEKLEYLYFSSHVGWACNWRLPRGLGRMKALRVVNKAILYDEDVDAAREIGELTQLRSLSIFLSCSEEVLQELAAALQKTQSLRSLFILDHTDEGRLNVLRQITSPPPLLRSLRISGDIEGMPMWFGSLTHLVNMHIGWTFRTSDEVLGIMCKLPSLQCLTFWRYVYTNEPLVAKTEYQFPVLKKLSFISDHEEQRTIIFEQGTMPVLEILDLRFLGWEKGISGIEHLPSLKEVTLSGKRSNDSLNRTVMQLKSKSDQRPAPKNFKVVARYEENDEEW